MVLTAVSVSASWLGIRSVMFAAAPSRATPLSAAELRRMAPTRVAEPTPTAPGPSSASPTPASPSRSPVRATSHPPGTPAPTPTWTPEPDGHGSTAYLRTFQVTGGTVTILASPTSVSMVSGKPARGFTIRSTRIDSHTLAVMFQSSTHYSRVVVTWRNGPQAELTESVP
jgi:hypothetical protein